MAPQARWWRRGRDLVPKPAEDLSFFREPTFGLLGEDELTVAKHVELPLAPGDVPRVEPVRVQLGRETRGPLVIARSGGAVVDLDGHT